ncbi:hypothetical protein [Bacillus sp. HMF5848]|uniref:hypothetical protein n=1 Tax=Bacillus sp. HMF5848 TaxID=2495421 RepID=UPI0021AD7063|nr:hypothetical protein [Bacillus sp. HMF5848]
MDQVEGNDILAHYTKLLNFRANNSDVFAKGDRDYVAGGDSDEYLYSLAAMQATTYTLD